MLEVRIKLDRRGFCLDLAFTQHARVLGVFGHSGAGKSTLLHAIAGLERPNEGRICIDDDVVFDSARRIDVPASARRIGLMFQDDRLFPHLSVEQNLRFGERLVPEPARRFQFPSVVAALKLEHLLTRRVQGLSGGERQRVALGRALLCSPRLLLFDEPLSSLDLSFKLEIMPFLREALQRFPIPTLYVSHDLTELLQLTDELLVIREGRVVDAGRYLAIARNAHVIDAIHHEGLMNVFTGTVAGHDLAAGITFVSFSAIAEQVRRGDDSGTNRLATPLNSAAEGKLVQVLIRPEDISLARSRVEGISIQNQLAGTVCNCTEHGGRALVEIDAGRRLLAIVSVRTAHSMNLIAGQPIWCLIKSSAIQVRGA